MQRKVMELSAAGTTAAKSFSRDSAEVCSFELIERDKEQPWRSLKGVKQPDTFSTPFVGKSSFF